MFIASLLRSVRPPVSIYHPLYMHIVCILWLTTSEKVGKMSEISDALSLIDLSAYNPVSYSEDSVG